MKKGVITKQIGASPNNNENQVEGIKFTQSNQNNAGYN